MIGLFAFKAEDYFEISKNLDIFAEVYKEVNTTYVDEVKPGQLIRSAIDGMLKSLDPYTNFYSEAQAEDYRYQVTGTYAGIGSTIRTIGDYVYIESPVENFPAHKAGLLPGDKILTVDGEEMKGKKSSEVTEYLKGKAGTSFELTIERMGEGKLSKSITRENIKIKNSSKLIFCDTNISTTLAWSKTHFDGFCDPWLLSQSKLLKYDYYLLLNTDVAWIKDDLRDTPNDREKMFLAHKFELDNLNVNYDIIEGSDFDKRLIQAVDYIKKSINFD